MKVRIKNFQSLADTQFEATGLTVIVGDSNIGKSAAIRAITGALFNRPGEGFVRLGHTSAEVELTGLPTSDGRQINVKWLKGHNTNGFVIEGETFNKVGVNAPAPLQAAGYKDTWIGDKDRSKGESIRPQVAEQFDRLFLLDRLGSFVSDVLSVISRLAVLLRAHQRSSSDLKSQKQTLGIRRKDLEVAEAKLAVMEPITTLHARISGLEPRLDEAGKDYKLVMVDLKPLAERRAALVPFRNLPLPTATDVPPELDGATYIAAKDLVGRRARLHPLTSLSIPSTNADAVAEMLVEALTKTHIRDLAVARARFAPLQRVTLPAARVYPLDKIDALGLRIAKLQDLVRQRMRVSAAHFDAVRALKSATDDYEDTKRQLDDCMADVEICPVCDRPMGVPAAV